MTRSSLTRYAGRWQDPDPAVARQMGQEAFRRHGVVCIPLAEMEARCGYLAAKHLRLLGEQYFGKQGD